MHPLRFGWVLCALLFMAWASPAAADPPGATPAAGEPRTTQPAARADDPLRNVRLDPASFRGSAGFFRVGQDTLGRWWFITPDNRPFVYRGVTSINRAGTMGGRRAVDGEYAQTVDRSYSTRDDFARAQVRRLRQWGFNALGAWCTDEFYDLQVDGQVMPYTEILEFGYVGPNIVGDGIWLPDVFDPRWQAAADVWAEKICTPRRNGRYLVGYFTDNELTWAQPSEEALAAQADPDAPPVDPRRMYLLQHCLTLPADSGSFKAAWAFVSRRYGGDMGKLGEAWGVRIVDSGSIRRLNPGATAIIVGDGTVHPNRIRAAQAAQAQPGAPANSRTAVRRPTLINSRAYLRDQAEWSRLFAEQYFRRSAEAIRKADPNHLILGCRFGGPPGPDILAAMKPQWVDVVSANNYRPNFRQRMDIYYQGTGLPVLNGEFAYHSGHFSTRGRTPEGMARMGATALEELFTHPAVVGYTWYRWVQSGGPEVGRGLSCGLVHIDDQPRKVHIDTLTAIHSRADTIAAEREALPRR